MSDEKLAQALRDAEDTMVAFLADVAVNGSTCGAKQAITKAMFGNLQRQLAAHERAQPASVADGYAYSCADGFLRVNQGAPVNGGKPIDAIPFYFAPPPAQPASVPDGWVMVPREPTVEMLRAEDSACPDRGNENRDPYAWGRASWAAFLAAAPQAKAKGDDHGN